MWPHHQAGGAHQVHPLWQVVAQRLCHPDGPQRKIPGWLGCNGPSGFVFFFLVFFFFFAVLISFVLFESFFLHFFFPFLFVFFFFRGLKNYNPLLSAALSPSTPPFPPPPPPPPRPSLYLFVLLFQLCKISKIYLSIGICLHLLSNQFKLLLHFIIVFFILFFFFFNFLTCEINIGSLSLVLSKLSSCLCVYCKMILSQCMKNDKCCLY